jgi:HEAT repeat protein
MDLMTLRLALVAAAETLNGYAVDGATVDWCTNLYFSNIDLIRSEEATSLDRCTRRSSHDDEAIADLISMLSDRHDYLSFGSVTILHQIGVRVVPRLVEALRSPLFGGRRPAIGLLGEIGHASTIPALIDCLGEQSYVGSRAAKGAGNIWNAGSTRAGRARPQYETVTRSAAIDLLAKLRYAAALPALIRAAAKSNEDSVRSTANMALGEFIGKPRVAVTVEESLQDTNKSAQVRCAALRALVKRRDGLSWS